MTSRQWVHNNSSPLAASEAKLVAPPEEDRLQQQALAKGKEGQKTPEQCFRKVDRRIRSVLQHNKHLPSVSDNIVLGLICRIL